MFERTKRRAKKISTGVERGLGLPILINAWHSMQDVARGIFNIPKLEQKETFEQAMSRLHLTEAGLVKVRSRYLYQCVMFLLLSGLVLAYSLYLFLQAAYGSGLVSLLITVVLMLYALRAHFWAFQIKNRKLGCSLTEWWENRIFTEEELKAKEMKKKK